MESEREYGAHDRTTWDHVWTGHWYSSHDRRVRRASHKLATIEAETGQLEDAADICEVGCGAGYFLEATLLRYSSIRSAWGCDHSIAGLELAADRMAQEKRVHFAACYAGALPFQHRSFDVLFLVCVLEHVRDIPATIAECHRVLRPGGRLHVFYSSWYSVFAFQRIVRSMIGHWPYAKQEEITPVSLRKLLSSHFKPVHQATVQADSDFGLLRKIDAAIHRAIPVWGRYLYAYALKH
jgi:ubiquinone/menaquinone biosynthesis C-methylase UbiE